MTAAEKRRARWSKIEAALGDRVICHCGATLATYADECAAGLEWCPGADAIEAAAKETDA